MHFEALRRAVRRDDDAAGGRQRVVVDDRDAGLGEADPVAELCGTGSGPGKVAGIVRAGQPVVPRASLRWLDAVGSKSGTAQGQCLRRRGPLIGADARLRRRRSPVRSRTVTWAAGSASVTGHPVIRMQAARLMNASGSAMSG
jgi:hypothetical protein